jgi:hypothetical protein
MAGGTWKVQNKVRPGVYIDFVAAASPNTVMADRGVATMPLIMDWGPEGEVIEVLSSDLLNGNSRTKIGYGASDSKSLLFCLCLSNCYKLLAYRLNRGEKADAVLGNLTATAKYSGLRGNDISLAVLANDSAFDVVTFVDGSEEDRQTVSAISELADNDWLDFSGSEALAAVAVTALTGGTNGSVESTDYEDYFTAMKVLSWQVMGIPSSDASLPPLLKAYIVDLRDNKGKKVQGVAYNYLADHEGMISSKQGFKTATATVSAADFVAWLTGAEAGTSIDESLTYRLIDDAVEIVGEMTDDQVGAALQAGWLVISKRVDGKIIVEQDINTLVSFVNGQKDKNFRKNRVIRTLDEIGNSVALLFELYYIGKVDNSAAGRDLFKADIINYFKSLQAVGAIQNFAGADDITVTAGSEADSVVVQLAIQPVDSMEKLYMTVEVA